MSDTVIAPAIRAVGVVLVGIVAQHAGTGNAGIHKEAQHDGQVNQKNFVRG